MTAAAMALIAVAPVCAAADLRAVVGVAPFPPHVMDEGDRLSGFDIDIWNEIADSLDLESEFRIMPFERLLQAIERREVDVALAGISVTHDRELNMDFSVPYMNTGLRILTRINVDSPIVRLIRSVSTLSVLAPLIYLLGFIIVCAHVLYFVERGSPAIEPDYFPGIFEAAWCILATITTVGYGDIAPVRWIGRFVAFLVMGIGISLFGVAVAELSSGLMMQELKGDISGPQDLRDRPVATVAGSTSAQAGRSFRARMREVSRIEEGFDLLATGDVDAVLFDAAPLMRHARQDANRTVVVVGPLIEPQFYAIAFPQGSPLREFVNQALLKIFENGEYEAIYGHWFGDFE